MTSTIESSNSDNLPFTSSNIDNSTQEQSDDYSKLTPNILKISSITISNSNQSNNNKADDISENEAANRVASEIVRNVIDYAIMKLDNEYNNCNISANNVNEDFYVNQFLKRSVDIHDKLNTKIPVIANDDDVDKHSERKLSCFRKFLKNFLFCCKT